MRTPRSPGAVADEIVRVPAPTLALHVELAFRDGVLVSSRFAREPGHDAEVSAPVEAVASRVRALLATGRADLRDVAVDLVGLPPFHRETLEALRGVRAGEVVTYGELARRLGRPGASRAVGAAMAANPIPVVVPCHRVVQAGGGLGNYSGLGGVSTKAALLRLEGADARMAALSPGQQRLVGRGPVADV